MTTLEKNGALIARLFAEADANQVLVNEMFSQFTPEEAVKRMSDPNSDYRAFYGRMNQLFLPVSRDTATLLYMLARANHAKAIVEFGTSFGISTIHLAAALRDNGGGRLIGTELEANKVAQANKNLRDAGLADLVDVREGDALQTLARDLPDTIDGLLLDGHKPLYVPIFELVAPRLRTGSFIVADNVKASPQLLARLRSPGSGYLSVPFGDDVELSMKL